MNTYTVTHSPESMSAASKYWISHAGRVTGQKYLLTQPHGWSAWTSARSHPHASRKYGDGDRLEFKVGSCTSIPLPDNSVDGVVSFETLEHLAEHEEMLGEVKRVLRPGGFIILSTPDKLHCTIIPKNHNPFHVLELTREEFAELLHKTFSHVYLFEQRICHCSLLAPTADLPVSGYATTKGTFVGCRGQTELLLRFSTWPLRLMANANSSISQPVSGRDIPTELEKRFAELGDELRTTQHKLANAKKTVRVVD